jgi:hypothetical protein
VTVASVACSPAGAAAAWSKGCGRCRSFYERQAWAALPLALSLPPTSVQAYLSVPASLTVEVRRCGCGAMIAALG